MRQGIICYGIMPTGFLNARSPPHWAIHTPISVLETPIPNLALQLSSNLEPPNRYLANYRIILLSLLELRKKLLQACRICLLIDGLWLDISQPCSLRQEYRCAQLRINLPRNTNRKPMTSLLSSHRWSADLQLEKRSGRWRCRSWRRCRRRRS